MKKLSLLITITFILLTWFANQGFSYTQYNNQKSNQRYLQAGHPELKIPELRATCPKFNMRLPSPSMKVPNPIAKAPHPLHKSSPNE